MARDFMEYQHEPSAIEEKKLYTYRPSGRGESSDGEVSVALDFGEIVTLEVNEKQKAEKQKALSRAVV